MIERIFILHHTHVDFGYTDAREKVCADLVSMAEKAAEIIEQSKNRPAPERFRWVHETSWPVLEYLRTDGKMKEKIFEQMREGWQELTALYVDPTDLFDLDTFTQTTDRACKLAKEQNLPLTTAMFGDCPGLPWSVADILAERGVKYLSAAPDFIMSCPLEIERPFYWVGPNGGRLLTWFTDWRYFWYAEALFGLKLMENKETAPERLNEYLGKLESEGYRWKGLAIHYAMDNEFPVAGLMDFVAKFNAQYPNRQVQMATNREFFEFMEKEHHTQFPVCRGAWPDWWANGNGSAAYETGASRQAKRALVRARTLAKVNGTKFDQEKHDAALEDIIMYDEHTWGHSNSVTAPWSAPARLQWNQKRTYAVNGLIKARRLEFAVSTTIGEKGKIVIQNPFDFDWTGLINLKVDGEGVPYLCDTRDNARIEGQRHRGMDFFQVNVKAGSVRRFTREASGSPAAAEAKKLENSYFRIERNAKTGLVEKIFDKTNHCELTDPSSPWSLGQIIHEKVKNGSREKIYDIKKGANNPEAKRPRPEFVRTGDQVESSSVQTFAGPVFDGVIASGELPGVKFEREIRLFHGQPRIDIILRLDKQVDTTYESLYLAFPFAFAQPTVHIENAGAIFKAGVEQLPGSATDWHSIGHYAAVSDGSRTVVLVPHDVPLVQICDLHVGKWAKKLDVTNGHLYSWMMNNMWFTNFPAYQEGKVELTWSLTTKSGSFDPKHAENFYNDVCLGAVVSAGDQPDQSVVW